MTNFIFNTDSLIDRTRAPYFKGAKPTGGYCYKFVDAIRDTQLRSLNVVNSYKSNGERNNVGEFLNGYNLKSADMPRQLADLYRQSIQDWVNLVNIDIHECNKSETPSLYLAVGYFNHFISFHQGVLFY